MKSTLMALVALLIISALLMRYSSPISDERTLLEGLTCGALFALIIAGLAALLNLQ